DRRFRLIDGLFSEGEDEGWDPLAARLGRLSDLFDLGELDLEGLDLSLVTTGDGSSSFPSMSMTQFPGFDLGGGGGGYQRFADVWARADSQRYGAMPAGMKLDPRMLAAMAAAAGGKISPQVLAMLAKSGLAGVLRGGSLKGLVLGKLQAASIRAVAGSA